MEGIFNFFLSTQIAVSAPYNNFGKTLLSSGLSPTTFEKQSSR